MSASLTRREYRALRDRVGSVDYAAIEVERAQREYARRHGSPSTGGPGGRTPVLTDTASVGAAPGADSSGAPGANPRGAR